VSLLVGLTGGMGSGKSLAAKFFAEQGAHIIDADQLSRELVRPGNPALKEIVDTFGEDILEPSGNLDREALAKIIFDDTKNKSALEAILHPKIIVREQEMYLSISASDHSAIVIVDAALLIESGNYKNVDKVILVQSREEQQIKRILSRGFQSYDQAIARIKNQMSFEEKIKYADYILDNQSEAEDLRQRVQEIYAKLLNIQ
jgi:dephospho-CoA kinase